MKRTVKDFIRKFLIKSKIKKIPCRGYWIHNSNSHDFDCEYPNSANFGCEDCICNGGKYDPKTGKEIK